MSYDLLIKHGTLVDGSGGTPFEGDVAIRDGRIAAIGQCGRTAKHVINATDLVVSPGFIDQHTHYDAQICWDPLVAPSSWHGVTTVILGNCGVGVAPCRPDMRDIAMLDLVNLEGMPYDVLKQGMTWDWETFPEYMDSAAHRGTGINLGFLAPLTPFRHYIMGEASLERAASTEEAGRIANLLRDAVAHGAFGFSTTTLTQHVGYGGRPIACRNASRSELGCYCEVLKEFGRGGIMIASTSALSILADEEYNLLDFLLTESERPVAWSAIYIRNDLPDVWKATLKRAQPLIKRGAVAQVSPRPLIVDINLRNPFLFANIECWAPAFNTSADEQKKIYSDASFRASFRNALVNPRIFTGDWARMIVKKMTNPALKRYEGRSVADIARERNKDGVDTFIDLALDDDLNAWFTNELCNTDDARVGEMLKDPRVSISLSDGGAHVDMLCDAGYPTYLLGTWVRENRALSLEYAVRRLTSEVAKFWGMKDRGRLSVGMSADIAIFDPATVGSDRSPVEVADLPGGASRLVTRPRGMHYTIVNGEILFENLKDTGLRPGRVLHSAYA